MFAAALDPVGFPRSVLSKQLSHCICSLTEDSVSIPSTAPEHAWNRPGSGLCLTLVPRKERKTGPGLMGLVSGEADAPTERCSVCDIVHFVSPARPCEADRHTSVECRSDPEGGWPRVS